MDKEQYDRLQEAGVTPLRLDLYGIKDGMMREMRSTAVFDTARDAERFAVKNFPDGKFVIVKL
jgi:hypothetical protein